MTDRIAYSVREAAATLGISEAHLYRQIDAGEIPAVKMGGRTLIARTVLERIVDPVMLDLRGVHIDDVVRLERGIRSLLGSDIDEDERRALSRLDEQLNARIAHAEALAAPLREPDG